jgi:hypothetical protein
MASLVAVYLLFSVLAMAAAKEALGLFWLPGLLAMWVGAQFLIPIGLAHAGALMANPSPLGWIVLIVVYSAVAYALGWVIRALLRRE